MKRKSKTLRNRKKIKSKTLKKQKQVQRGGFVPSIFHGVTNAAVLAPLALKQAYRLWTNGKKTKRSKK